MLKIGDETFVTVGKKKYFFIVTFWKPDRCCTLKYVHDGRTYYVTAKTFIEALGEMLLFRHAIVIADWKPKTPSTQK